MAAKFLHSADGNLLGGFYPGTEKNARKIAVIVFNGLITSPLAILEVGQKLLFCVRNLHNAIVHRVYRHCFDKRANQQYDLLFYKIYAIVKGTFAVSTEHSL